MSAVWFLANTISNTITSTIVDRHTDSSVWISVRNKSRRNARITEWGAFFPTWDEAKEYLQGIADRKVQTLRIQLEAAKGRAGNVRDLKNPET